MNPLKQTATFCCDRLVGLAPQAILNSLRKHHYELVAREFNRAFQFDWSNAKISERPEKFEDLVSLFDLSPMTRGIIRQDFDEAAALFRWVRSLPDPIGVEIGRFNGGSTLLLAVAIGQNGKLASIDISPQDDAVLDCVLQKAKVRNRVELVVGDANKIPRKDLIDFVFIDGDHSYEGAKRDHNKWGKLVRRGGFVIHHDMGNGRKLATQWNELARLRSDILSRQSAELELVQEAGSMSVFRKKSGDWTEI
ncbi:MAG: class I SAM-dependent methyltransferase [Verrucomicrobia bacterium]|nr:class I SAM-dependent methyltransferase [Verrucomicrobiota bacterium]